MLTSGFYLLQEELFGTPMSAQAQQYIRIWKGVAVIHCSAYLSYTLKTLLYFFIIMEAFSLNLPVQSSTK